MAKGVEFKLALVLARTVSTECLKKYFRKRCGHRHVIP